MISTAKNFDTVKWLREIRDKFYEDHKHLSLKDYINAHINEAKKFESKIKTKSIKQTKKYRKGNLNFSDKLRKYLFSN